jgi:hypothetical protein
MGEMADWLIEQGMAAEEAHQRGDCEYGCPRCTEEEAAEKAKQKAARKRRGCVRKEAKW